MIICGDCLDNLGLSRPPFRTESGRCERCGREQQVEGIPRAARGNHPLNTRRAPKTMFTYPDELIPGTKMYEEHIGEPGEGGPRPGGSVHKATRK